MTGARTCSYFGRSRGALGLVSALVGLVVLDGCSIEPRETVPPRGVAAVADAAPAPGREIIIPEGMARLPVFSPIVRAGDFVFLSGQIGTSGAELRVVDGGVGPETTQTLRNVDALLAAAGAERADLVKCTVFLADIADYAEMNTAYLAWLDGGDPPARSAMAGSGLALGARVEIECLAYLPRG